MTKVIRVFLGRNRGGGELQKASSFRFMFKASFFAVAEKLAILYAHVFPSTNILTPQIRSRVQSSWWREVLPRISLYRTLGKEGKTEYDTSEIKMWQPIFFIFLDKLLLTV